MIHLRKICLSLVRLQRTLLFLLFAASLATAQTDRRAHLRIITKPKDATLILDGKQVGTSPMTVNIDPGKHLLIARKSDYVSIRRTIELKSGQADTLELHLTPVNGLILVHSNPAGVDVQINGASHGTTPLFISDLPLGKYRATFSKPGYMSKEIELRVTGRTPKKYDITLIPDTGSLNVESEPPGATVTVNGANKGLTPCTVDKIPSGETILELDMPGYRHYKERVVLAAGDREHIRAVLKPIPSNLKIVSIPPKARIYVNNQYRGMAPVELKNIAAGTYHVRAEMPAYDINTRDIQVGLASSLTEEFRLVPNAGAIEITTEPSGVQVLLNGKTIGVTPDGTNKTDRISLPLVVKMIPSGDKVMKLTKPGYFDQEEKITIVRDQTFTRHYKLKRRFIPDYEIKTAGAVYRGVLVSVDAQHNVKLETCPGVFKTINRGEIVSYRPLREDEVKKDIKSK